MQFDKKVIIVTGGGNGIGRELVLNLLKKGTKVAAVDLKKDLLDETIQLAGDQVGNLSTHALDIAEKPAVDRLPEEVISRHGALDGIINCAGIIQPFVRVNNLEFKSIEHVMNVNFYGTLYLIKAALPHLLKRPEAHIANVSSMGGFLPVPGQSVYGASKAAVKLLTEGLYAELLSTSVNVSLVFPGAIATRITQNSGVEIPGGAALKSKSTAVKTLSPVAAAETIINGMERNKLYIYVGNDAKMMNFLYRLIPGFATRLIAKKMKDLLP